MSTQWQWWCAGVVGADAMGRFMRSVLGGMLVLVLPSFFICLGIALMAYRKRNLCREE
ncbi:MAG: hypothetical protein ABJC74_17465 [Gemmatimonadota bacterium]